MSYKKPHPSRSQTHRRTNLRSLVLLALLSSCTLGELAEAQQRQACDVSQFQGNHSSIGWSYPTSCTTCVFPSWQAVSLDTTAILQLDLTGKWLYMLGDSTTLQLHEALLGYLDEPQSLSYPGEDSLNAGAPPHTCTIPQPNRCNYVPPPYDLTPCYLNQQTCTSHYISSRLGSNVTITYDWKHFMYEDYDRQLFNGFLTGRTPDIIVTSPGAHDCLHYPAEYQHHGLEMQRYYQHLRLTRFTPPGKIKAALTSQAASVLLYQVNATVVMVDTTPFSQESATGIGRTSNISTLTCVSHINQVAYGMAQELGFFLFSRQSLLLSGNVTQDGKYPIHQPQPVMREELRLLLSWMGCLQHDTRYKFASL